MNIIVCSFICILAITIGHAAISALNLNIYSNAIARSEQANFRVKFVDEENISPKVEPWNMGEATIVDDTTATFNISGDMRKGDSVVVKTEVESSLPYHKKMSASYVKEDTFVELTTVSKDSQTLLMSLKDIKGIHILDYINLFNYLL